MKSPKVSTLLLNQSTPKAVTTVFDHLGVTIEVEGNISFEEWGNEWSDIEMCYNDCGTPLSDKMYDKVYREAVDALNESYYGL